MPELMTHQRATTREQFERDLLSFIAGPLSARRSAIGAMPRIDRSTPLFESGLIDSLAIIDLLAFVESAIGARIPLRQIDMRYFGTVERIVHTFWVPSVSPEP